MSKYLVFKMTREEALRYGLLICVCGHPVNNHFKHGKKPCAFCKTCNHYAEMARVGKLMEQQ